jgi:hypothetical protein
MDICVEDLIRIENLKDYKLHLAVWNYEEQPLDVFVRSWNDWVGWNQWRGDRDDFTRPYIFSLIRFYPRPDKWLFGGIFEVKNRRTESYELELVQAYEKYVGRLLVHYPGPGARGRAFYLENHYSKLVVAQVFENRYSGEAFCGYENIDHPFPVLEVIFKQGKHDWKAALENVKGVYLIADTSNGKMYVGSAYGEAGIWSRWANYIGTGHGWNDALTRLIVTQGIDYARHNFKFSILEYRAMKTDDQVIIDREQYWKRVLLSGTFGYNKN